MPSDEELQKKVQQRVPQWITDYRRYGAMLDEKLKAFEDGAERTPARRMEVLALISAVEATGATLAKALELSEDEIATLDGDPFNFD